MQPETSRDLDHLKQRMRATWMAGDFGQIANYSASAAAEFVGRLHIQPGTRILDIACGTGNLAIPAARAGAVVTGIDIAPNLLEQARKRAAAESLPATFEEGDAEQLPYPDAHFDVVMSMFGAMFAPRPERVAAEMIRVCKRGGTIAMANWGPQGFAAAMFAIGARFLPPPEGIPAQVLWGDPATAKARLANGTSAVQTIPTVFDFVFPFGPSEVVELFKTYFGPTRVAYSRLDSEKQKEYTAALEQFWRENNLATDGAMLVKGEYLTVIAKRA